MSNDKNEYGRFQLHPGRRPDTHHLYIENVNRADDHWLTLSDWRGGEPIGYIKLTCIGQHMFEVVEVRSATAPLRLQVDATSPVAGPLPAESELHE